MGDKRFEESQHDKRDSPSRFGVVAGSTLAIVRSAGDPALHASRVSSVWHPLRRPSNSTSPPSPQISTLLWLSIGWIHSPVVYRPS